MVYELVTTKVTYLPALNMDGLDMIFVGLVLANVAYAYVVARRLSRKRKRSCWAHEWLLDRDNPAKTTMINLYSDLFMVRSQMPIWV